MNFNYCIAYGGEPEELSAKYVGHESAFKGGECIFPGGYAQITDALAKGLKVKLSTEVTEIDYTGPKVKVRTSSGRWLTADQVVVTVPLTILRTLTFKPALSPAKQTALSRLGVGILDKLYLEFDRCFWNPGADWLVRVDSEWTYSMNCLKHNTGKPILLLFTHGAQSKRLSELSDAQVVSSALAALKGMYPEAPTQCKSFLRTNWLKDRHAQMSYSFL